MKIRLSVPPKPKEHKSIVPSHLLSDPAFSPDPHLNPYFDQQLAWIPPQGHPVLKHKNRGPVAKFALRNDIIASADFDFQLLQPPNSPVPYLGGSHGGTQEPLPFPFSSTLKSSAPVDSPALNTAALIAPIAPPPLDTRSAPPVTRSVVSTVPVVSPHPPAAKTPKKRRMPFISRRKSQLPPPNLPSAPPSSSSKIISLNDVSRPIAPRIVSEPVTAAAPAKRPLFLPRSATTGTDTPRSTGTSSFSVISKRHGVKDLDRIDELDETSPWGIALHHGGPYEAAAQALKRIKPADTVTGSSTTLVNEYHTQYGQPYIPPAPAGFSLNLSPGQILPRNFGEQRPAHPRPREIPALPPRMQQAHPQPHPALSRSLSHVSSSQTSLIPPRHMNRMKSPLDGQSETPSRYRRQSQPVSPSSAFPPQLLNNHPDFHIEPRADHRLDLTFSRRQSQTYQQPPLVIPEPTSQPSNSSYQPSHDFQKDLENIPNVFRRQSQLSAFTLGDSIPQPQSTLRSEPENASDQPPNEAVSFNIGMLMLQAEDSREFSEISIATPRIFLPLGTPDHEKDFDPYDPIHLNNEHSRTPSLVALYAPSSRSSHSHESMSSHEPSRIPSPDHPLAGSYPDPNKDVRAPEMTVPQEDTPHSVERSDPPPYSLVAADTSNAIHNDDLTPSCSQPSHFRSAAQTSTSSRNTSPDRPPSRKSTLSKRTTLSVSSDSSHRSRRGSPMMQPSPMQHPEPIPLPTLMQDAPVATQIHRRTPDNVDQLRVMPVSMSMPSDFARNGAMVNQQQQNVPSIPQKVVPTPNLSRERLTSPPPSNYAKSTHPSLSTYSSNQTRNGPPPVNRHLPKRLVMPAPLNNMSNNGSGLNGYTSSPSNRLFQLPQTYTPPRQIPPRQAQAAFQPQPQAYHQSAVHSPASKPHPPQMLQAQEIHTAAVHKLKKRTGVMPPASAVHIPQAPIISTVSFAPHGIGFGSNASVDKALSRAKADKFPKRVLSKRRTDL